MPKVPLPKPGYTAIPSAQQFKQDSRLGRTQPRSKRLKRVDEALRRYNVTGEGDEEQLAALDDLSAALLAWRKSKEIEPDTVHSRRKAPVEDLLMQVAEVAEPLRVKVRMDRRAALIRDEIFGGEEDLAPEEVFDAYIGWFRDSGRQYVTNTPGGTILDGAMECACDTIASGLVEAMRVAGHRASRVHVEPRTFITKQLDDFIDPDARRGNLILPGQTGPSRYFFSDHYVVPVGDQVFDPTAGIVGDAMDRDLTGEGFTLDRSDDVYRREGAVVVIEEERDAGNLYRLVLDEGSSSGESD